MLAAIVVAAVVIIVAVLAYRSDVLATRGPRARSDKRRYDRAYERSRGRPGRG
jgi:uncharacterized membrane protein